MGTLKKEVDIVIVTGTAYAFEKYPNGKPSGEYEFLREIEVIVNSPYGTEAMVSLTIDEAKHVIKLMQDAVKKASVSEKQLVAAEKKREKGLSDLILRRSAFKEEEE